MIKTTLDTVLIGTPQLFRDDGELSAIVKRPVNGPIHMGEFGLEGNQVADMLHHGGRDKAVHLYPSEHYAFWREKYPDADVFDVPGAFGENFSCSGLTEDILCLGDVFRVGEAVIQCSHARSPCWKLNHRFGKRDALKTVIKTTKSGSYFRVLETGQIEAGDQIEQTERLFPNWPLTKVFELIVGGKHKGNEDELRYLSKVSVLADSWRERAKQLSSLR